MANEPAKIIKTIIPEFCPHCKKPILICYQMMTPSVTSLITLEEVKEAKEEVRKRLAEITFKDPQEKNNILGWLNSDEALIGLADVDSIIKQILKQQSEIK